MMVWSRWCSTAVSVARVSTPDASPSSNIMARDGKVVQFEKFHCLVARKDPARFYSHGDITCGREDN